MTNLNFNSLLDGSTQININVNNGYAEKINAAINANMAKIKKAAKVQRPSMIVRIINSAVAGLSWRYENKNGITIHSASHPADVVEKVRVGKTVYQYDKNGNLVNSFPSVQAAHRATGIADSAICYCANNKYGFKTAGGFKWTYQEIA